MIQQDDAPIKESRGSLKLEFKDEEYRQAYAEDFLNSWVATQIVTLREQREMSQTRLGELIGTKQPGISRLEDVNHSTWKTETLKRIARALGVRLRISFETFGTLLDEDVRFSREFLKRPEFIDDPEFIERRPIERDQQDRTDVQIPFVLKETTENTMDLPTRARHGNTGRILPFARPDLSSRSATKYGAILAQERIHA
jgi:transcriptional regulator with XRE-family HTH domain